MIESWLNKPISRRSFVSNGIKTGVALAAIATVGCETVPKKPITIEPTATPETIREVDGYRIFINNDALPYKYEDPSGVETQFDLETVKVAREKALEYKEPEVVGLISVPQSSFISSAVSYSPDHPEVSKLPDDVLSETELERHGVKIIQADNTTLSIRKGALESDGQLAQFDGKRKLIVAVLDAPAVFYNAALDSKYDGVRSLLHEKDVKVKEFRAQKIAEIQKSISDFRNDPKSKDLINSQEGQEILLGLKVIQYEYENTVTDEQLVLEVSVKDEEAAGEYFPPYMSGIADTAVIFIAAGNNNSTSGSIRIFFSADGTCGVEQVDSAKYFGNDFSPQSSQTYPNPLKFKLNIHAGPDDPKSYPYGGQTPGQILWHELEHDKLIMENNMPDFSEYDTDIKAMDGISKAWFRWVESGYKDNSGYYFVFSLGDGGYILTEGKDKTAGGYRL